MAVVFRQVTHARLRQFSAQAPDRAIIGVLGLAGSGKTALLRLAGGLDKPASGEVLAPLARRYMGPLDPLDLTPAPVIALDHTLALCDPLRMAMAELKLLELARRGATILICSYDRALLARLADEIWWIDQGQLVKQGDPGEVLREFDAALAQSAVEWARQAGVSELLHQTHGDGRAELVCLETLDEDGQPGSVWQHGRLASVRVVVRYHAEVPRPVVGMLIRTPLGMEVFGTNTELERADLGPCLPGDTVSVQFTFECLLAPRVYTVTAASHDPGGCAHEWREDALAVAVVGSAKVAGVVCPNIEVVVGRLPQRSG